MTTLNLKMLSSICDASIIPQLINTNKEWFAKMLSDETFVNQMVSEKILAPDELNESIARRVLQDFMSVDLALSWIPLSQSLIDLGYEFGNELWADEESFNQIIEKFSNRVSESLASIYRDELSKEIDSRVLEEVRLQSFTNN